MNSGSEPRTLPCNLEAELAVLGAVMLRGRDALLQIAAELSPEDFYVPGHRATYKAMLELDDRGEPIDVVTLEDRLRRTNELEQAGGLEQLAKLADRYATALNVQSHARIIKDAAQLRRVIITAREIAQDGLGPVADVRAFIDEVEQRFLEIGKTKQGLGFRAAQEVLQSHFKEILARAERAQAVTGVPTGFYSLDDMTAGFQPGDLVILAARPSMGKTAFALNIAQHACVPRPNTQQLPREKRPVAHPVLFFSLEMGAEQLIERMLCAEARLDFSDLRAGRIHGDRDFDRLIDAADRITYAPLHIDDHGSPSVMDIRTVARRWRADRKIFDDPERQIGMIMVDYLQLCRGGSSRYDSRTQEISEISRGLKSLAKELRVPVVALSQLNRELEKRADKRPMLSDLRESGAIEQDADLILFIHREERYLDEKQRTDEAELRKVENKAEIIVGKQRNGPIGTVHLHFIKRHTRFENPAQD